MYRTAKQKKIVPNIVKCWCTLHNLHKSYILWKTFNLIDVAKQQTIPFAKHFNVFLQISHSLNS